MAEDKGDGTVRAGHDADLEGWLEAVADGRATVQWMGSGAEAMGLTGEADPETVRNVFQRGTGPDGEPLDIVGEDEREPQSEAARIFGEWLDRQPPRRR
jgi:hypothetical protein